MVERNGGKNRKNIIPINERRETGLPFTHPKARERRERLQERKGLDELVELYKKQEE